MDRCTTWVQEPMTMEPPNILYLHSHDTGRYVQPYGHAIPTPNIQRLAEEGILFRHAFSAAPTCSPSRACLLTGQSAHSNGMLGLAHRGFVLKDYKHHIIHTLKEAGYYSTLIGVQHIAKDPSIIGYDEIVPTEGNQVCHVAPQAVENIREAKREPFFLAVGFSETHRIFAEPGPDEDERFTMPPHPFPDLPKTRRDMAGFKASARILDEGVGMVLKALDEAGLADNTLVICTTDHGIAFPTMKCNLTDGGMGVMLIMRGPGGFSGGRTVDALVSQIDLFPTICELVGLGLPEWLEGRSIMPIIRGEVEETNDEIFSEVTYHASYEPQRAVRTREWKYIRRFDGRTRPVLTNCDDGTTKEVWIRHGWRERYVPVEQLYNLIFDPNETNNVAGDPGTVEVLKDMRARLDKWMNATNDPLLEGAVPPPSGALVNDPNGLSPREKRWVIP